MTVPPPADPLDPNQPPAAPPPPAAGYDFASSRKTAFDPKTVSLKDWGILAAGLLAFIFSFFSYYTATLLGVSDSENAWNGFFGWAAALLALAGAGLLGFMLFVPDAKMKLPWPHRLITLSLFAVATLFVLLALVVFPESVPSLPGLSTGRGVGYWLSLIVIVAGGVLSYLRLRATGGKLPWEKR